VGKNGVVRDKAVHAEVIHDIADFAFANGFSVLGLDFSPVKGPKGNIEYLMFLQRSDHPVKKIPEIDGLVEKSHRVLNGGESK